MRHEDHAPTFGDTAPIVYAACQSGPCRQGRAICPTPQACARAEPPALLSPWWRSFAVTRSPGLSWRFVCGAAAVCVAVALLAGAFR